MHQQLLDLGVPAGIIEHTGEGEIEARNRLLAARARSTDEVESSADRRVHIDIYSWKHPRPPIDIKEVLKPKPPAQRELCLQVVAFRTDSLD